MIVAEVGNNHHGSEEYANEYLKKSIISGVDGGWVSNGLQLDS